MDDIKLARIFYIIVHDFATEMLFETVAGCKRGRNHNNKMECITNIHKWAKENDFGTLRVHSENLINRIKVLESKKV